MSTEALTAGAMIAHIAGAYWPLFACLAFSIVAISGICALFMAAESVHGRDEPEDHVVINFEKWRD